MTIRFSIFPTRCFDDLLMNLDVLQKIFFSRQKAKTTCIFPEQLESINILCYAEINLIAQ